MKLKIQFLSCIATLQVVDSYMGLVATMLNSTALDYCFSEGVKERHCTIFWPVKILWSSRLDKRCIS